MYRGVIRCYVRIDGKVGSALVNAYYSEISGSLNEILKKAMKEMEELKGSNIDYIAIYIEKVGEG